MILKNKTLDTNTITKMKEFNSQVCTTKIQSQRLLSLGLKPETADMFLFDNMWTYSIGVVGGVENNATLAFQERKIPAWSLHRLMEIYSTSDDDSYVVFIDRAFDDIIEDIEWSINKGYFNKEYLKQWTK